MVLSVNLSLFALHVAQFSIYVSQMMHQSYFSIRNSQISYNYIQPFYNQFNTGLKSRRNCVISRSKFSHFLQPVFSILNGPDSDINRDDIVGERPTINLNAANLTVYESLFQSCQGVDGGVFFVVFGGDVIIEKTNFVNCSARGRGGVIFFYGSGLTISESCFSACSSNSDGYCIFCANGRKTISIQQCHFCSSEGGKSTTAFLTGFDISTKNLNCTNSFVNPSLFDGSEDDGINDSIVCSSFYISPSHHFLFELIEVNNNSGPFIIYLDNTDQIDTIQNVNIINCQLSSNNQVDSNSLIFLTEGTTIFKNWGFIFTDDNLIQAYNSNNPLVLFTSSDQSTLTLQNCFISLPATSVFTDNPQLIIDSSVKFESSSMPNINFIKSEGCWNQNRFKFREPKTYQKIIISIVVILIFVAGFIWMIVEAFQDEKKHKELLKQQEYNEMQNDLIQGDGTRKLDANDDSSEGESIDKLKKKIEESSGAKSEEKSKEMKSEDEKEKEDK